SSPPSILFLSFLISSREEEDFDRVQGASASKSLLVNTEESEKKKGKTDTSAKLSSSLPSTLLPKILQDTSSFLVTTSTTTSFDRQSFICKDQEGRQVTRSQDVYSLYLYSCQQLSPHPRRHLCD